MNAINLPQKSGAQKNTNLLKCIKLIPIHAHISSNTMKNGNRAIKLSSQ